MKLATECYLGKHSHEHGAIIQLKRSSSAAQDHPEGGLYEKSNVQLAP